MHKTTLSNISVYEARNADRGAFFEAGNLHKCENHSPDEGWKAGTGGLPRTESIRSLPLPPACSCSFQFHLLPPEVSIEFAVLKQVFMVTAAHQLTALQDDDAIGVFKHRQAV